MIQIQEKLMTQYVIVATGEYGASYHLVKASRMLTNEEAKQIALSNGALPDDKIEVKGVSCNLMYY